MRYKYMHSPLRGLVVRNDSAGDGLYGSMRRDRAGITYAHKGVDLAGEKFDNVYAPADCEVIRIGQPYIGSGAAGLKLIVLKWDLGSMKLMYMKPSVSVGALVQSGQCLGTLMSVSEYHNNRLMQDHIHWEVSVRCRGITALDRVDPLMFFSKEDVQYGIRV